MTWKYYWLSLWHNVKAYIKGYNVYLALKVVRHKPYDNLQLLLISTHHWKDLLMDFVTRLLISTYQKNDSYNSILVIVNWLIKMVHYKPLKVIINASSLAKVILDIIVWHYGFLDSIVNDRGSLFTSKFWSLLYYFLDIKHRLFIAFHF